MGSMQKKHAWRVAANEEVMLAFAALCVLATIANHVTAGTANRLVFTA